LPITKRKALAYITWGNSLLVFRHPHVPAAGIQVPGGTIEEGESPEEAVLREAIEETGLQTSSSSGFSASTSTITDHSVATRSTTASSSTFAA
jgi:8-oxo-dGTP pyrophosphatase MutT (NUDIX family)